MKRTDRPVSHFLYAGVFALFAAATVALLAMAFLPENHGASLMPAGEGAGSLNPYILSVIDQYPTDGSYPQMSGEKVNTSYGTTQDVYYQGRKVASGNAEKASYCIGLVFEVYMRACEEYAETQGGSPAFRLPGVTRENVEQFRKDFYGVDGNKRTFIAALHDRGLGKLVTPQEAKTGDLVQFWRGGGSGHAVVLKDFEFGENGFPTAINYWSVQSGTKGIGFHTERIGSEVIGSAIHIVRPTVPQI